MKILKTLAIATMLVAMCIISITKSTAQNAFTNLDKAYQNDNVGDPIGCYTTHILDCGLSMGQQLFCNFTGSWGAPYNCSNHNCYGSITHRQCVLVNN